MPVWTRVALLCLTHECVSVMCVEQQAHARHTHAHQAKQSGHDFGGLARLQLLLDLLRVLVNGLGDAAGRQEAGRQSGGGKGGCKQGRTR